MLKSSKSPLLLNQFILNFLQISLRQYRLTSSSKTASLASAPKELSCITQEEFIRISEFLQTDDYAPRPQTSEGASIPNLPASRVEPNTRSLPRQAVSGTDPMTPDSKLAAEAEMKKTVLTEIADRYYELVIEGGLVLSRLMIEQVEIAAAIGKALHEDPAGAGKANLPDDV